MCKKLICLLLFTLVLGVVQVQAQGVVWERAAWWDGRYPTNWADEATTVRIRDGLVAAGYTLLDSDQLKTWMNARIADKKLSVVVLCRDIPPDTVTETMSATCTLRKYLDAGGKIVFYADIPFYNQGHKDGTQTNWAEPGASNILGIGIVSLWDSNTQVTITAAGIRWGLTETWASVRPYATTGLTVLATDAAGNAAAWVKHYVAGDNYRGFVRLWDRGGGPSVEDIIRVAEFRALKAAVPSPPDGATGVLAPLLQWQAGVGAFHDVYFGTNPTPGPAEFKIRQTWTVYWGGSLTPGTTYYWRIDEVEADGVTIHTGDIWSFTAAPLTAFNPNPADGAKWVATDADLSWSAGATGIKHDVYFGTDQAAVANGTGGTLKSSQQATKTYEPGTLAQDTTYYWRIDEYDSGGTKYPGTAWSFTTIGASAGIRGYYFNNMNVTGAAVLVRIDPTIDFNWGDPGSPDPVVNVDQFSARWVGVVEAQYSEPYTFTSNSDDGIRVWLNDVLIIDSWIPQSPTMHSSAAINLVAGQRYGVRVEYYEDGGGAVAQLYWQSPSTPRQIIPAGALQLPLTAGNPSPPNGAVDVKHTPTLRWSVGEKAVKHNVYFGTDATAVANATTASAGIYRGQQDLAANSYVPTEAPLAWNSTYYWRIDEVNGVDLWKGGVWSFTTANFIVVDDFEDYTDDVGSRIFQTWKDGWGFTEPAPGYPGNGTGSAVGYAQAPFAEQVTVHGGGQSMPLGYDNTGTGGKARYSETFREWASPQDWTINNVKALTLYVQGNPLDFLESSPGTFTMSAEGTDIWGASDEFRYVYKQLSGDGEIIARVDRIAGPGTNTWGKAGVMIRETLDPTSFFASMVVTPTPSYGLAFQYRDVAGDCDSEHGVDNQTAPYWVKLVRKGNQFTGYHSPDGINWTMKTAAGDEADGMNPVTITMASNVYIGLALTSHENDVLRMAQFSNVSTTGSVTGAWTVADIATTVTGTNSIEPLYVAVEDNTAKVKVVANDNSLASVEPSWQEWNIDLAQFSGAGLNLKAIKKMYIGLGNRTSPKAGGTGLLYIDDIRVYKSRCVPSLGKPAADLSANCVVDYADIEIMAGDWLASGPGLAADLRQDNVINFKDFAVLADSWLEELLWP